MNEIETNKAIIEAYLADYSSGDVERIATHLHTGVRWWVSGTIEGISGTYDRVQMLDLLGQVTEVYTEGALKIAATSMIGEGSRVAVEAESDAELHNGRVYHNQYHFVFEIKDGKIIDIREYLDTQHVYDTFVVPE